MFNRFEYSAKRVVVLAQEHARMLNHGYVGTEHVLLALLTPDLLAAEIMRTRGVEQETVRRAVIDIIGFGLSPAPGAIAFTKNARRVLIRSADVAGADHHIVPEHLLLALLEESKGVGVDALKHLGIDLEPVLSDLHGIVDPAVAAEAGNPAEPMPVHATDAKENHV